MSAPTGGGFPKAARLRCRREYLALGRTGRRSHSAHFIVLAQPREGVTRLGVTVSRKVGGAVTRNRVKRRVREVFRRHPERLLAGHDLLVIAKPGAGDLPICGVVRELTAAVVGRSKAAPRQRT
jgi:ribonuclease P protein component